MSSRSTRYVRFPFARHCAAHERFERDSRPWIRCELPRPLCAAGSETKRPLAASEFVDPEVAIAFFGPGSKHQIERLGLLCRIDFKGSFVRRAHPYRRELNFLDGDLGAV